MMKFIGRAVQGPPDHGSWTKFVHQVPKRAHKRVALKHRGIFTETSTKHVDGLQMLLPQHVCEMIDDDSSCQLPAKGNCLELTRDESHRNPPANICRALGRLWPLRRLPHSQSRVPRISKPQSVRIPFLGKEIRTRVPSRPHHSKLVAPCPILRCFPPQTFPSTEIS